jgi:hypothetical protein
MSVENDLEVEIHGNKEPISRDSQGNVFGAHRGPGQRAVVSVPRYGRKKSSRVSSSSVNSRAINYFRALRDSRSGNRSVVAEGIAEGGTNQPQVKLTLTPKPL